MQYFKLRLIILGCCEQSAVLFCVFPSRRRYADWCLERGLLDIQRLFYLFIGQVYSLLRCKAAGNCNGCSARRPGPFKTPLDSIGTADKPLQERINWFGKLCRKYADELRRQVWTGKYLGEGGREFVSELAGTSSFIEGAHHQTEKKADKQDNKSSVSGNG